MPEREMGRSASGPLQGIRVLDFGAFLAGSYHATLMGDLGADVIKVEPLVGDPTRQVGPFVAGESRIFVGWNRNKRGLAVDLRTEAGLKVVYDLVQTADVVTTNFRPRAAKKLKVDYDTLAALNPQLIYSTSTGFGSKGPLSEKPAYDGILQSMGGIAKSNEATSGKVSVAAPVFIDIQTATLALGAVLAALFHRERTGEGQLVETSLLQGVMVVQPHAFCQALEKEEEGGAGAYPYKMFETEDGHIFVGATQDKFWRSLCLVLGLPALAEDSRYGTIPERVERYKELAELIDPIMLQKKSVEWEALLEDAGVPCGAVRGAAEFFDHPQVAANDMDSIINHTTIGPMRVMGVPFHFGKSPGEIQRSAPLLGEHTKEILRELEYDEGRIEELEREGAIAT